jgi:hypothetical protein
MGEETQPATAQQPEVEAAPAAESNASYQYTTSYQRDVAEYVHHKLEELAKSLAVEGEHHTVSLQRAGVAVGIESPVNVMGNDKPITAQDLAALELREALTGQRLVDWMKHFES